MFGRPDPNSSLIEMRLTLFFSFLFLRNYAKILSKEKGPLNPYPFQKS